MLLCEKIDLDLEEPSDVYANAQETIQYLQDVVNSLEARVLGGEKIDGFEVVEGAKTRVITEEGYLYLEKTLGKDVVYKKIEKPIGIGELEKIVDKEDIMELFSKGVLAFKPGKPKVILKKK